MVASNLILGVITGFKAGTAAVIEYDQALHDLQAITQTSSTGALLMGDAITKVAGLTKFSMGEVAGAMKKLGQAGFNATEITKMIGPIAQLATGSLESLEVTVGLVSTAIRVFRMDVEDTSKVADIFSNAVTKSRLTISGLNTAFNYIGPIASATGLSLKDTSASMMLLANSGLRFSTIATGLRRVIGGLGKPTGDFKSAIISAGYSVADFNPLLTDWRDILENIPKVVKNSTDAISFFGLRGSSVISALSTQGVSEYDRLRASVDSVGTTAEMAVEQMRGLQNAIKNIKDRFGVLAKTLSEGGTLTVFKFFVQAVRDLLSVLIEFAGTVTGQTIVTLGLLGTAFTGVTAAILAFTSISLGTILTGWVSSIVAVTAGITGIGMASFTATAGVVTLRSAFSGLIVTATAFFLTNPIGMAIGAIGLALAGYLAASTATQKSFRKMAIESEKYAQSLDKTISKLSTMQQAIAEQGKNSDEAKDAAKVLREDVIALGNEYEELVPALEQFTKEVDKNTGVIDVNYNTMSDLSDVLNGEYRKSILDGIAATEALTKATDSNSVIIRAWDSILGGLLNKFEQLAKFEHLLITVFGGKLSTDVLDKSGLIDGLNDLMDLKYKIEKQDDKAIVKNKKLREGGVQLYNLLLKTGKTKEYLAKLSDYQISQEILGMKGLTYSQKMAAASLYELLQQKRKLWSPEIAKMENEAKTLAVTKELYEAFGLSLTDVSVELKEMLVQFGKLSTITGKHKLTTSELIDSFEKVGESVKTAADFKAFLAALDTLKKSNKFSITDLQKLGMVVGRVFEKVKDKTIEINKKIAESEKKLADEKKDHIKNEEKNRKNANKKLLKLADDYNDKRIDIEKDLAKALKEIDDAIAANRREAEQDIKSLETSTEEKIRGVRKKGMSEKGQEASDEYAAQKYMREGVELLNKAEKEGDESKLARGLELVQLSESLATGLANRRTAVNLLNKSLEASKKARNIEAHLKELELIRKKEEEIKKAAEDQTALETAYKNKVITANTAIDEIIMKENERHKNVMDNLEKERQKYRGKFKYGTTEDEDVGSENTVTRTKEQMEQAKEIARNGYRVIKEDGVKTFTNLIDGERKTVKQIQQEISSTKDVLYKSINKEGIATYSNIKTEGAKVFSDFEEKVKGAKEEAGKVMDDANIALDDWHKKIEDIGDSAIIDIDNSKLEETTKFVDDINSTPIITKVEPTEFEKVKQVKTELQHIKEIVSDAFEVMLDILGWKELVALKDLLVDLTSKVHQVRVHTTYTSSGKKPSTSSSSSSASGSSASGRSTSGRSTSGRSTWRSMSDGGKLLGFGGGDRRHILGEDGEWIINKYASKKYGDAFMSQLNNMALPKFAGGGKIGESSEHSGSSETLIVRFQAGGVEAPIKITDPDSRTAIKGMAKELTRMRLVYAK